MDEQKKSVSGVPVASPSPEDEREPRSTWAWIIATFFGAGYLRPGPGTWTSAITVLLWWAGARAVPAIEQWFVAALVGAIVVTIGIPACGVVERESGLRDPHFATIDEVAGQLFALIDVPLRWQYLLVSFILFRAFDILKPPPLSRIERLEGGAGIMLDDVAAGLYAVILLHVLIHFGVLR